MKIQITVGITHDKSNRIIEPAVAESAQLNAESRLLSCVPGFTVVSGRGAWKDDSGQIIIDTVLVYTFLIDPPAYPADHYTRVLGDILRDEFNQSCVVREVLSSQFQIN